VSKKKVCSLLLLLTLTISMIGLTSGCSQEEQEFMQLISSINDLKVAEETGQITLKFNSIPKDSLISEADAVAFAFLEKGLTLNYTSKQDVEKNMLDCRLYYVNPQTGSSQEIMNILAQNNVMYMKLDGLINLIGGFSPEAVTEYKEIMGDNQYVRLTKEEYVQTLGLTTAGASPSDAIALRMLENNNFVDTRVNRIMQNFLLGLADIYKNYRPNLITKNGDSYTLSINGAQLVELMPGLLEYSLDNLDALETYLVSFLDTLTNEELGVLGLSAEQKEQYKVAIATFGSLLRLNKENSREQINELQTEILNSQEDLNLFEGVTFEYALKEKSSNTFDINVAMMMDFDSLGIGETFGSTIESQSTIRSIPAFNINIPTANVISFTELEQRLSKTMEIAVDQKICIYKDRKGEKQEQIEALIIDNYTYLPLRQIASTFNEEVEWDAAESRAYVNRSGLKIDMTGTLINNRTFIKIRDFEKLGYKISWDAATRTAKITKTF
jgi:hypothetical protein